MLVFRLNGECHGSAIFTSDLQFSLRGTKVVKSVQQRVIDVQNFILNQVLDTVPSQKKKLNSPEGTKQILSKIRTRNKQSKGPWLRRPDQLYTKIIKFKRSMGLRVEIDTLPGIETMFTNFNQIVLRRPLL